MGRSRYSRHTDPGWFVGVLSGMAGLLFATLPLLSVWLIVWMEAWVALAVCAIPMGIMLSGAIVILHDTYLYFTRKESLDSIGWDFIGYSMVSWFVMGIIGFVIYVLCNLKTFWEEHWIVTTILSMIVWGGICGALFSNKK